MVPQDLAQPSLHPVPSLNMASKERHEHQFKSQESGSLEGEKISLFPFLLRKVRRAKERVMEED